MIFFRRKITAKNNQGKHHSKEKIGALNSTSKNFAVVFSQISVYKFVSPTGKDIRTISAKFVVRKKKIGFLPSDSTE